MPIKKCCGTCKHWNPGEGDPEAPDSHCDFDFPNLPFWATVSEGDHRDYTTTDQGKFCPTWVEKGE